MASLVASIWLVIILVVVFVLLEAIGVGENSVDVLILKSDVSTSSILATDCARVLVSRSHIRAPDSMSLVESSSRSAQHEQHRGIQVAHIAIVDLWPIVSRSISMVVMVSMVLTTV
jgi:hypothetical protein